MKLGEAYVQLELRMAEFEKKLKSAETKLTSSTDKMNVNVLRLSKSFLALAGIGGLGAVGMMIRRLVNDASQFNREALALSKTMDVDLATATGILRTKIQEQHGAWADLRLQIALTITEAIEPATSRFRLLAGAAADAIAEMNKYEAGKNSGGLGGTLIRTALRSVPGLHGLPVNVKPPIGTGWTSPESENAQFLPTLTEKQREMNIIAGLRYQQVGIARDALGNPRQRQLGMDMSRPAGAGLGGAMSMLNIDETVGDMNRALKDQLKQEERAYLDDIKKMNRDYWHWELEQARINAEKKLEIARENMYKLQHLLYSMSNIPGVGKYASFISGALSVASGFMDAKSMFSSMGGSGLPAIKDIAPMPGLDGPGVGSMGKAAVYNIDLRGAVTNADELVGILDKVAVGAVVRDARQDGVTRQMFTTRQ